MQNMKKHEANYATLSKIVDILSTRKDCDNASYKLGYIMSMFAWCMTESPKIKKYVESHLAYIQDLSNTDEA